MYYTFQYCTFCSGDGMSDHGNLSILVYLKNKIRSTIYHFCNGTAWSNKEKFCFSQQVIDGIYVIHNLLMRKAQGECAALVLWDWLSIYHLTSTCIVTWCLFVEYVNLNWELSFRGKCISLQYYLTVSHPSLSQSPCIAQSKSFNFGFYFLLCAQRRVTVFL